jgi:hypothetical protein
LLNNSGAQIDATGRLRACDAQGSIARGGKNTLNRTNRSISDCRNFRFHFVLSLFTPKDD